MTIVKKKERHGLQLFPWPLAFDFLEMLKKEEEILSAVREKLLQLKSKYLGTLLSTTSFDVDGGVFSFAFGVVDEENDDRWICPNTSSGLSFGRQRAKDPGAMFVAGATRQASIRIAQVLLREGYSVRARVSDLGAAQELTCPAATDGAVKCPSISYHLASTKKIKQELEKPNVLERFLENKDDIAELQKCFAGFWRLDESTLSRMQLRGLDCML
ncbi:hypothetical protein FXO38_06118 [Capsicum annuum]|nr:hypothetical protein FXO38_06118 [Capsicum annuum]